MDGTVAPDACGLLLYNSYSLLADQALYNVCYTVNSKKKGCAASYGLRVAEAVQCLEECTTRRPAVFYYLLGFKIWL